MHVQRVSGNMALKKILKLVIKLERKTNLKCILFSLFWKLQEFERKFKNEFEHEEVKLFRVKHNAIDATLMMSHIFLTHPSICHDCHRLINSLHKVVDPSLQRAMDDINMSRTSTILLFTYSLLSFLGFIQIICDTFYPFLPSPLV